MIAFPIIFSGGRWFKAKFYKLNGILPSLIHDYAAQRYWNSAAGAHAFPFTATRTSNATMFDGQGRLVWAPANLVTYSSDFTNAAWQTSAGGQSTKTTGQTDSQGGSLAVKITALDTATSGSHTLQNTGLTVVANASYTFQADVKAAGLGYCFLVLLGTGFPTASAISVNLSTGAATNVTGTTTNITSQDLGNGWYRVSFTGVAGASGAATCSCYLSQDGTWNNRAYTAPDTTNGVLFGRPQVEPYDVTSPKAYNATTSSAYYGPRIDYDPNGNAALGLLVEEARTNSCPDHLTVTMTNGSVATGTNFFGTASKQITFNGTSAPHNAYYGSAASAPTGSSLYTISAYVRKVSGSGLIQLSGSTGFIADTTNDYANFDLNTGTVVNGSSITDSSIVSFGNNIYRISMTFTTKASPAAGSSVALFGITSTSDTRSPTNTSSDVFECFGAQLESGRGVSSLIPTYGAAATRNADTFSTTSVSWLDQTKGTWYASVVPQNALATARRAVSISDGTANNAYSMLRSTGRALQPRTALSGVADFTPTTANTSSNFASAKMALLLNSPTKKTVLNGGTVASASVAFPTSGYTTLTVGADAGAYAYWQGWIKELRYYADASASDGQLQTLTT